MKLRRSIFTRRRLVLGILAMLVFPIAAFHLAVWLLPYPSARPTVASRFLEDRNGQPLAALVSRDQQWHDPLTDEQISPHLLHAIVAVEDTRFYSHHGVDWCSAEYAVWEDLSHLRCQRGASTITMQLHRLRFPARRSFFSKLDQAIRAEQIEKQLTKKQILTEYLNRAPFGGNTIGAQAASWRYFGIPCSSLSLSQAALLAGLPQSPSRLRPDRYPKNARARRNHVLDRMLACGFITPEQLASARAEPVRARRIELPQFDPDLASALPTLAQRVGAPGHLQTTLDASLQRQATRAAREQLTLLSHDGVDAVAVVVLDTPSAQCLAAVSLCPPKPSLDLLACPRSTGSALKPFIYAAAFEACIANPDTLLPDSPAAWPAYVPGNFDHRFVGTLPASAALAQSRNIPALHLLSQLGVGRATGLLQSAGFSTLSHRARPYGLSLAVGGAEATPLELATAYATLARGGKKVPATFSTSAQVPARSILLPRACFQVIQCLSDPDRTRALSPHAAQLNIAWKTGTSSGQRDAWCAAVTPRRTVVVWLGNVSGRGSHALIGAEAAAPLALDLLASIDPVPASWPSPPPDNSSPIKPLPTPKLTLLSPPGPTQIILDRDQPQTSQQFKLQAVLSPLAQDSTLWWFVDGRLLASADAATPAWWVPVAGRHEVRVVDAAGHATSATLTVR